VLNKRPEIDYKPENKQEIKFSKADIVLVQKELGFYPKIKLEGLCDLVSISH